MSYGLIDIQALLLLEKSASCPPGFIHAPSWLICKSKQGICCIVSDKCCGDCAKNRCNGVGGHWMQLHVKSKSACKSPGVCHIGESLLFVIADTFIVIFSNCKITIIFS